MKLLFIDHDCHRTTASAGFFVEILRSAFAVAECRYQNAYRTGAQAAMRGRVDPAGLEPTTKRL